MKRRTAAPDKRKLVIISHKTEPIKLKNNSQKFEIYFKNCSVTPEIQQRHPHELYNENLLLSYTYEFEDR